MLCRRHLLIYRGTRDEVATHVNSDLEIINMWLVVNLLSLKVKKSNYIIFNHGSHPKHLPIVLEGQSLYRVDKIKHLNLRFSENIC